MDAALHPQPHPSFAACTSPQPPPVDASTIWASHGRGCGDVHAANDRMGLWMQMEENPVSCSTECHDAFSASDVVVPEEVVDAGSGRQLILLRQTNTYDTCLIFFFLFLY
jgi:hypothetical protein